MLKRVLQVMGTVNRGGLETFVMNIYRNIDRTQIQFDFLLTQGDGGDYAEEIKSLGGNIYFVPPRNLGIYNHEKALDNFFQTHCHDYVAVHDHKSYLSSISVLYCAKKYGIPMRILHSHSSSIPKDIKYTFVYYIFHYLYKPFVKSCATHYMGCSDKAISWMFSYTGVLKQSLMINNAIDCHLYERNEQKREKMRAAFAISSDDLVIGHVGRFIPLKNHIFLLKITKYLVERGLKVKLLLVGDGELLNSMKQEARDMLISENVIFTGLRTDIDLLLQAMDVFVMPSWFEGLPMALVEAQAAGIPIIASDTISKDSDLTNTILFKSLKDSPEEWGKAILAWHNECGYQDNIERLSLKGFDIKKVSNYFLKLYTAN